VASATARSPGAASIPFGEPTIRAADIGATSIRSVSWPGGATAELVSTYADVDQTPAALIGSAGHLEIAGRGRRVADIGGPRLGDPVVVELG